MRLSRAGERLETRSLLNADSPWQNVAQPLDVNVDGSVAPLDALIVINDLNAHGARPLASSAAQGAQPIAGNGQLVDVDGDQFVSPLDALMIINSLDQAAAATVRVRLVATNSSGTPITTIEAGQSFQLRAFVQDLRPSAQGVFASYFDVAYAGALADVTGTPTFTSDYPSGRLGDTTVDGLINEIGAFAGLTPLGSDERLLFTLDMQATAAGTLDLAGNPADILPAHDTLLFGQNTAVPVADIEFVGTSLTITGGTALPSLSVADATVTEGNDGTTSMLFTVTLSAASQSAVTVNYATGDGTASAGADYEAKSGQLTFAPGETSKTIEVLVQGDTLDEPNETLTLTLSNAVGATLQDAAALGTIIDDDAAPSVSISIADASALEGNSGTSLLPFVVSLSAASGQTVTVDYATIAGTATAGTDFTAANGTVTFAPGETQKTINVAILGDTAVEADENFQVQLTNAVAAEIADGTATGLIQNDDQSVEVRDVRIRLQITDLQGNDLTTIAVGQQFMLRALVTDTRPTPEGVFAAFLDATYDPSLAAVDGSLTFGADYPNGHSGDTATAGLIDEAGGFAGLTPLGADERLLWSQTLTASAAGLAQFGADPADQLPFHDTLVFGQGTPVASSDIVYVGDSLTITGATGPSLSIDDVTVTEGNDGTTEATFTVSLSQAAEGEVTVDYTTADGTAAAGSDYESTSGQLVFAPGETTKTITVLISGDTENEPNEMFTVQLSNAVGAEISDATGQGTIINDDGAGAPTLSVDDISQDEGNDGTTEFTFTVTLSAPSEAEVTVNYATGGGNATPGNDYEAASGQLVFAPGETTKTITVLVTGDTNFERNETFQVQLSDASGADIADGVGVATIVNDDEGNFLPGVIRGGVYADVNNNGIWDTPEHGVVGATVHLQGTNILNETVDLETVTDADGHYEFSDLVPGDYTLLQTQPGFYLDGIDALHDDASPGSAGDDQFSGIALGSGDEFGGYDFGERGLRPEFISRRLFLATTPASGLVNCGCASRAGTWYSFDEGWVGDLTATVSGTGNVGLTLYDAQLRPLATSTGSTAASLTYAGQPGHVYFLSISGAGTLNVQFANEAASAAAMAQAIDAVLADDWA
ncbi:MAG: Calx-beta domain-containing protein [Pirellulales bacterium]